MDTKYQYYKTIKQNYGNGWEQVEEFETNSTFSKFKQSDMSFKEFKRVAHEYKLMGYPTKTGTQKVYR